RGAPPPRWRGGGRRRKEPAVHKRSEPEPTSQKYRDRYFAAQELAVRAYCDFFGFWRFCPYRPCRRARGCRGDEIDCFVARRGGVSDGSTRQEPMCGRTSRKMPACRSATPG